MITCPTGSILSPTGDFCVTDCEGIKDRKIERATTLHRIAGLFLGTAVGAAIVIMATRAAHPTYRPR